MNQNMPLACSCFLNNYNEYLYNTQNLWLIKLRWTSVSAFQTPKVYNHYERKLTISSELGEVFAIIILKKLFWKWGCLVYSYLKQIYNLAELGAKKF